jgi:hypothetical protein
MPQTNEPQSLQHGGTAAQRALTIGSWLVPGTRHGHHDSQRELSLRRVPRRDPHPVRAKAARRSEDCPWSSERATAGRASPSPAFTVDWLLAQCHVA